MENPSLGMAAHRLGEIVIMRVAVAMLAVACGPSGRELCQRNGGLWLAVNCHEEDTPICTTYDVGGVSFQSCFPFTSTVCDHVCRNAAAEDIAR